MWNLLRGLGVPPLVVASARGIVEAGLMAAVIAVAQAVSELEVGPGFETLVPLVVFFLRGPGEGLIDQIDPKKKRRPDG